MRILQVPLLSCHRCKRRFVPSINPDEESVMIPKACPKRDCRSKTWNLPDEEVRILRRQRREKQLRTMGYEPQVQKVPVLDKYAPKKPEKKPLVVCVDCEEFYHDEIALENHRKRRHYGLCRICHASNVYVRLRAGMLVCSRCHE